MFEYAFMQRAFLAGIIIGVAIPCVGVVVVFKRLSMMGDALSHASLAGVAAGLIGGIDPVLGATIACLGAAGAVEAARRRFEGHAELAIAVVMSCGIGLAGVLSGFVPNAASFSSFLFGSIVAVSDDELAAVAAVGTGVLVLCILLRKELFLVTLDERAARVSGVNVRLVNAIFVLMTAFAVSVGARTVGALIVSSMMVVPVACTLQFARGWRQTVIASCAVGLLITALGLTVSYAFGLKPGGTIVLLGIALLLLLIALRGIARKLHRRS
jgi:zinc transport system permease protein